MSGCYSRLADHPFILFFTKAALNKEECKTALKVGANGQLDAVGLLLPDKVLQAISGEGFAQG